MLLLVNRIAFITLVLLVGATLARINGKCLTKSDTTLLGTSIMVGGSPISIWVWNIYR